MQTNSVNSLFLNQEPEQCTQSKRKSSDRSLFNLYLSRAQSSGTAQSQKDSNCRTSEVIKLGAISDRNPTVSHLLVKNEQTQENCWDIVHNSFNADKPFTKISPGTDIYMDTQTGEILWTEQKTNLQSNYVNGSDHTRLIDQSIHKASKKYNLPHQLIRAVIKAESDFQVRALSDKGAQGLMQLMPETAKELGVKNPYSITENIDGGARYLRQMLDRFDGDLGLALAAYNAGPGAVSRAGESVPYPETRQYVQNVLSYFRQKA